MTGTGPGEVIGGTGADPIVERPPVRRVAEASVDDVWQVLADGWSYATWVVGASRVRAVDDGWPEPGSRIHHSVGLWPVLLSDTTEVEAADPGRSLLLHAHGFPFGAARILITLEDVTGARGGVGPRCEVTIREDASAGIARAVPLPLRQLGVLPRNTEALKRLALLAERRDGSGRPRSDR